MWNMYGITRLQNSTELQPLAQSLSQLLQDVPLLHAQYMVSLVMLNVKVHVNKSQEINLYALILLYCLL